MKYLYISRQFNRSGYEILKYLLEDGLFKPFAVMLPAITNGNKLHSREYLDDLKMKYLLEADKYNSEPLKYFSSIVHLAKQYEIPVYEEASIKTTEVNNLLRDMSLDLIVLGGGWPELIPDYVIKIPRLGVINTHPSLLPEFRGTDIHRWQVYKGVKVTGTSIHYVDEKFDTGDILGQVSVDIGSTDTPQELAQKAAEIAGPLMRNILNEIEGHDPDRVTGVIQSFRGIRVNIIVVGAGMISSFSQLTGLTMRIQYIDLC